MRIEAAEIRRHHLHMRFYLNPILKLWLSKTTINDMTQMLSTTPK